MDKDVRLIGFTQMHDEFIMEWNQAMASRDTSALERMAENYYVTFFKDSHEKPLFFCKDDAITGMQQSVKQLVGAKKKFENRIIRLKDNGNAVVFYELLIEKEEKVLARFFTIENWQLMNDEWLLVREVEELIK